MTVAQENANRLENVIASKNMGHSIEEIIELATLVANEVKDATPMYQGNLNPVWDLWNETIKELESRL